MAETTEETYGTVSRTRMYQSKALQYGQCGLPFHLSEESLSQPAFLSSAMSAGIQVDGCFAKYCSGNYDEYYLYQLVWELVQRHCSTVIARSDSTQPQKIAALFLVMMLASIVLTISHFLFATANPLKGKQWPSRWDKDQMKKELEEGKALKGKQMKELEEWPSRWVKDQMKKKREEWLSCWVKDQMKKKQEEWLSCLDKDQMNKKLEELLSCWDKDQMKKEWEGVDDDDAIMLELCKIEKEALYSSTIKAFEDRKMFINMNTFLYSKTEKYNEPCLQFQIGFQLSCNGFSKNCIIMDVFACMQHEDKQHDVFTWIEQARSHCGLEEEDEDGPKSLDSLNSSESLPYYQPPEQETAFPLFGHTEDKSLTKQMEVFSQVLPSMDDEFKPVQNRFDRVLKGLSELLEIHPPSTEGSLCGGEDYTFQVE